MNDNYMLQFRIKSGDRWRFSVLYPNRYTKQRAEDIMASEVNNESYEYRIKEVN